MKRTLTLLISLLLLVSLLIPAASASNEEHDSTYVGGEILYLIGASENAVALRMYKIDITAFAEYETLSEIPDSQRKSAETIAVSDDGKYFQYYQRTAYSPTYMSCTPRVNQAALQFYLNTDLAQYLGNDIQVVNKYFFSNSETESLIYYRTNHGDYIYFDHRQIEPCLFSAEAFHSYMNLVIDLSMSSKTDIRPEDLDFAVWDLSANTLGSPYFDPNSNHFPNIPDNIWLILSITAAVLITATILIIVILYKKKIKDHNPYEDVQGASFDTDFVIYHTINDPVDAAENLALTPPN